MEATATTVERDQWDDHRVTVSVEMRVAHWHENPEQAALDFLRQKLDGTQSIYNWEGRFLIVTGIGERGE